MHKGSISGVCGMYIGRKGWAGLFHRVALRIRQVCPWTNGVSVRQVRQDCWLTLCEYSLSTLDQAELLITGRSKIDFLAI